jgi:hypothetical protein
MPALPANATFPVRRYERGRLGTGKGNGAGRRSLVKYNQPQGTPRLELEEPAFAWLRVSVLLYQTDNFVMDCKTEM